MKKTRNIVSCLCLRLVFAALLLRLFRLLLFGVCLALVRPALVVLFICFTFVVHFYYFFHVGSFRVGKFFRICFAFVYFGVCLFLSRWLFVSFVFVLRLFVCLVLVRLTFVHFFDIC